MRYIKTKFGIAVIAFLIVAVFVNLCLILMRAPNDYPLTMYLFNMHLALVLIAVSMADDGEFGDKRTRIAGIVAIVMLILLLLISIISGLWAGLVHFD